MGSMHLYWTLAGTAAFLVDWVLRIGFLLYVPRKRKPSAAIAWLLIIFLLPGIGIVLFLIIGSPKLSRHRRRIQRRIDGMIDNAVQDSANELDKLSERERYRIEPIVALNQALGKLPAHAGNQVKILPEYNKAIDDIVGELKTATEFIHLEYFILALDETTQPLFDALAEAVKRGVKVRVLFDALGSHRYPRLKKMKSLLTDIGVEWHTMLSFKPSFKQYNRPDLRNHRKILVIDDRVAYIGSQNLIDRSYHRKDEIYYNELVAKMTGPIVRQCDVVFAGDWFAETGELLTKLTDPQLRPMPKNTGSVLAQIVPSGPSYETENNARLFSALLHLARKKVVITNPYFVPDESILTAITSAARRGVEVSVINSQAIDQWMVAHAQRSYYQELINAGVKIYLYKYPVLLHSKHMTIDDDIAVIGSSNMDIRSFELDLECILVTYDKSVVADLNQVQKRDLTHTVKVNLKTWNKRPFLDKIRDSIARLTAALQ